MKLVLVPFFTLAVIISGGCATTGGSVEITGLKDSFEDKVEISTSSYTRPFMGIVNPSDYFFRGYIDKKTNNKTLQLYVITNSVGWKFWNEARILIDGELLKLEATRVSNNVDCSQYGCAHYEDMVVNLNSKILEYWRSTTEPIVVRYVSSRVSGNIDIEINKMEVLDFLSGVSSVKLDGK